MRIAVRIAGLAAAAALVLWCETIGIQSFTRQPGAGLHRLDGGAGLQVLIGLAALIGAGLVVAAAFSLTRPAAGAGSPSGSSSACSGGRRLRRRSRHAPPGSSSRRSTSCPATAPA